MRLPRGRKHVPKDGRAREITPAPGKVISARAPNGKADHMLKGEFGNEPGLFALLRVDTNVIRIQEQSPRIDYAVNETDGRIDLLRNAEAIAGYRATPGWRVAYYTADAEVEYKDGPHRIFEVKPESKLEDDDVEERRRAGALFALRRRPGNWVYEVITDVTLSAGERLHNARLLHKYTRISVPLDWRLSLREALAALGTRSARELAGEIQLRQLAGSQTEIAAAALALLAHGDFAASVDLNRERLTADTPLMLRQGPP